MSEALQMTALVGVIMGSQSDWSTLSHTADMLEQLGIPHEVKVVSAHRTPDRLVAFAKGAKAAGAVVRMNADAAYVDLTDMLKNMRQAGASYQAIADRLNTDGHTTRTGKPWNATAVWRVCKRLRVS